MAMLIRQANTLSAYIGRASPHKVMLVEKNLANQLIEELPEVLISNKAYGSDELY